MSEQIYGIHAVNSILTHSPERLIEVFVNLKDVKINATATLKMSFTPWELVCNLLIDEHLIKSRW